MALALVAVLLAAVGDARAQTPGIPSISSVTAGNGSLTVVWTGPAGTVTSYDLRYIETSEDETVDANWTERLGIWTSGDREYTLTGLDGEIQYDVQLRAADNATKGDWTATSTGTPLIGGPTIDWILVGDGALTVRWSPPPHAARVAIASYDVSYIESSATDKADANWTVETGIWTSGSRVYVLDGLTNTTGYDVRVRAVTTDAAAWSAASTGTPAEHGGTRAAATTMALGTRLGGEIDPGTDADYFKLVLSRPTGVLIFTTGELDTVGQLLDSSGTLIKENDDSYRSTYGIRNFLIWDSLTAGTYYIKVTGYDGATGSYVLLAGGITDTSASTILDVPVGTLANGLLDPINDVDWLAFTLTETTGVILRGTGHIAFELLDSSRRSVSTYRFRLPGIGFERFATLRAGRYYLRVSRNHPAPGPYTMYVLEADEPGSTRGTALGLDFLRLAVGSIDPSSDTDYFRIDLEEDTHVTLFARGAYVRLHGELQDATGTAVSDAGLFESFSRPTGFTLIDELDAGTHYLKVTGSADRPGTSDTGRYAVLMFEDAVRADLIDGCEDVAVSNTAVGDALYGCQWHLVNEGQRKGTSGEDINVEDAWTTTMGSGVNVAVVDDGLQHSHPDLSANVSTSLSHDYTGGGDVYDPARWHGTAVAGLIAARDNSIGVRGVAPRATIYGYNVLLRLSDANEADAMTRNMAVTAVNSNSWGYGGTPVPVRATQLWERAVESGAASGYSGNGVVYVWSAGNDADIGDYSNLDEYNNHYAVIAACAVNDLGKRAYYSELGPNLWVCAPSRDRDSARDRPGIATTDSGGRYTGNFTGTSASAPQVSGAVALVRAVDRGTEPDLSWRDVKLILAASARKNDPGNAGWQTGALQHGSTADRYEFNHEYGFGVVDVEAAVDLAGTWDSPPAMRTTGPVTNSSTVVIPNSGGRVSRSITVESDIDFVEYVHVNGNFRAPKFRDLQIDLVSPSGAVSELSVPETDNCPFRRYRYSLAVPCRLYGDFRFGSARHLGEDASGTWTLRMSDRDPLGLTNQLNSWSITVYGHKATPEAPALDYVQPGTDSLTVQWTAPGYEGSSAIAGYDVRHIRSDATNKASESAWTTIGNVGDATTRLHTVTGLSDGIRRDVQVRAFNGSGKSDWSVTGRGTPGTTNSEPFFDDGAATVRTAPESASAGDAIGSPVGAGDYEDDTFTYSLSGADAGRFDIDSSTGQLRVKDPLDFETRATYRVTVSVSDSKDDDGGADTATDASIAVTVAVSDVNEAPELVGDTELDYEENGTNQVVRYIATDPEGSSVIWTLSGTDVDDFNIDGGKIEFAASPDHENPTDQDQDNDYEIVVTVSDGSASNDVAVTITVTDENEPFTLQGDTAFDYDENGTDPVGTITVVDDPENGPIEWTLSGTDRLDFTVAGGVLSFAAAPDHESPADSNRDNRYRVTVNAFDGANRQSLRVVVTVTGVEEDGTVTFSSEFPKVGQSLTATLADPDGGTSNIVWEWHRSTSRSGGWALIDGADGRTYRPTDDDLGHHLRARAGYTDRQEPQVQESAQESTAGTVTESTGPPPIIGPGPGGGGGGGGGGPPPNPADAFSDLDEAGVHSEAVLDLATEGVLARTGCWAGRLCPQEPIRRWEMAVWLVRVLEDRNPGRPNSSRFSDVRAGQWWAGHVEQLARLRITLGCSAEPRLFCPDDPVTRAQMASFLVRAFELAEADPAGFDDAVDTGHDADIDALFAAGVTVGCSAEPLLFCPRKPTLRAEMASFLTRALELQDSG